MAQATTVIAQALRIADIQKQVSEMAFKNNGVAQVTLRNGTQVRGVLRRTNSGNDGFGPGVLAWYGDVTLVDASTNTYSNID